MKMEVVKDGKLLRRGYTTGSCAAAATKAAARMLLTGQAVQTVALQVPAGVTLELEIEDSVLQKETASCAVRKDAGDDTDVTDGILIYAEVSRTRQGFSLDGGEGVGRVTRAGLACSVGEAAINPVPRQMILGALEAEASAAGYTGGLHAEIRIPDGKSLAEKTFNPRLGIIGGISVLGTSGIVEPMSEAALIETIRLEIHTKREQGEDTLLLCPGNYGRDFALAAFGLDLETGVKCSNYIGEALDAAVFEGFREILLVGHAGKLVKLAAGIMNTHSRIADGRAEILSAHAALAGADAGQVQALMEAITVDESLGLLETWGLKETVCHSILDKIQFHLNRRSGNGCRTESILFTNQAGLLGMSSGAAALVEKIRQSQTEKEQEK